MSHVDDKIEEKKIEKKDKSEKSNFQQKGNPPFAGAHFNGRYLTGIPKKN